jgi:peptidyl-prolyl cis-trans isomerase SurA
LGQDTGFVVDKIIAKVDNYIVLKSELEVGYQAYLADGNPWVGRGSLRIIQPAYLK